MLAKARTDRHFGHIERFCVRAERSRIAGYADATDVVVPGSTLNEALLAASGARQARGGFFVSHTKHDLVSGYEPAWPVGEGEQLLEFSVETKTAFWLSMVLAIVSVFISTAGVVAERISLAMVGAVCLVIAALLAVYWVEKARAEQPGIDH